jgi:hypothetical protein
VSIEPSVADGIARVCRVLAAINFNDETFFPTDEIGNVRTNWFLPYEFEAAEGPRAQIFP